MFLVETLPLQKHPFRSSLIIQNHQLPFYASGVACIQFPSFPKISVGYFDLPVRHPRLPAFVLVKLDCTPKENKETNRN